MPPLPRNCIKFGPPKVASYWLGQAIHFQNDMQLYCYALLLMHLECLHFTSAVIDPGFRTN